MDKRDADFQRILQRILTDAEIKVYRLLADNNGTATDLFLVLRVLQQLTDDEGAQFSLAAPILRNYTHIDDFILFGAEDLKSARTERD